MFEDFFSPGSCCERLTGFLAGRRARFPSLYLLPAGKSGGGRKLLAAAIGRLRCPVLFAGGFAANDRISVLLLLRFLSDLTDPACENPILRAACLPSFFRRSGLIIVPMADPDGFEAAGAGGREEAFFPKHPGAEARSLARLCSSFCPRRVVSFTSPGEAVLSAYGPRLPAGRRHSGELFAGACGYRNVPSPASAEPGSLKDWFVSHGGPEGHTIKVGRSRPVPEEDLEPLYARLIQTMLLCLIL